MEKEKTMNRKQTYGNCKYFSIRNLCPYRDDELMKQFILETEVPQSNVPMTLNFSEEMEVNKICSSCDKFKPRQS
jgi:predicted transcriptional regulator